MKMNKFKMKSANREVSFKANISYKELKKMFEESVFITNEN